MESLEGEIEKVKTNIENNKVYETKYITRNNVEYTILILPKDLEKNINIESIVLIPNKYDNNFNQIILECNNNQTNNFKSLILEAGKKAISLAEIVDKHPAPIIIPILPDEKIGPYYQQLATECFNLPRENKNYRIDKQIVNLISKTKKIMKDQYFIDVNEKIILTGYSSSGVFAQRFSLIHPNLVEKAIVGGALGSIPFPSKSINYPIGIKNFKDLFGEDFNIEEYSKIDFNYYAGEKEADRLTTERLTDEKKPAPMHDMSYLEISTPKHVGKVDRWVFGDNLIERALYKTELLKNELKINAKLKIIEGYGHSDFKEIKGLNQIVDSYTTETYERYVSSKMNTKTFE